MKIIKIFVLAIVAVLSNKSEALSQNLNWASLKPEQRHILNVNAGYDYAFTYGVGYGYQLKTKFPIVLNLEHSQPAGEDIFDDFKTKIGGQIRIYQIKNFHFTAKIHGVFRRYENDYVRLINFGSDMSAIIGYYKSKWFVAGEFGFDKAIVKLQTFGFIQGRFSASKRWMVRTCNGRQFPLWPSNGTFVCQVRYYIKGWKSRATRF